MNKKTVMIGSGALDLILGLGACGTETYEYQVSGEVLEQYVDYDCPGADLALDAVSFELRGGKGGKKKSDSNSSDTDTDSGTEQQAAPQAKSTATAKAPTKTPKATTGTSSKGGTKSATPSPTPTVKKVSNKGVKLSKKPEKPEKLKGLVVPKPVYKVKPKGCETEYEIFVLSGGKLYEQDVRKVDFDKCGRAPIPKGYTNRLFPLCTKG